MKLFWRIQKHLKSNKGDGYILFCFVVLCAVIFFSAIFGILKTRVAITAIHNQIENTADVVISDMKQGSYRKFIKGDTEDSVIAYEATNRNQIVLKEMANLLGYDSEYDVLDQNEFIKNDEDGDMQYSIYDINIEYDDITGTIEMSFAVDVPIFINGQYLDTDTERYTKVTTLNFKD